MTNNKKQKLLSGILASTTALAGGTTILSIASCSKKNTDTKKNEPKFLNGKTVTFSAGDGEFVKSDNKQTTVEGGTTFDRVDQPTVKSHKKNKIFGGWVNEKNEPVNGRAVVNKDMQLKAIYNDISNEYVTVTFANDPSIVSTTEPLLQGNLSVSVNKGYYFFMVNRPSAKWEYEEKVGSQIVKKTKYFKGWKYASSGKTVQENDIINANVTMYPIFNEAVSVTFDPDGDYTGITYPTLPEWATAGTLAPKGEISRGQESTTLETGTQATYFNQPGIEINWYATETASGSTRKLTDAELGTNKYFFSGWYYEKGCQNPVQPTDVMDTNTTFYAKWANEPKIADKYTILDFEAVKSTTASGESLPTGMTVGYTPTDSIIITLKEVTWGKTNRPSIYCQNKDKTLNTDYKVDHWEVRQANQTQESDWVEIDDNYVFPGWTDGEGKNGKYQARPVLTYAIDDLYVYGDSTVNVEQTAQYNVIVKGGASSLPSAVTWELLSDPKDPTSAFPQAIAEINDNGTVTVKSPSRKVWDQYKYKAFYVKATSKLDTTKSSYLKVNIDMPYVGNNYIWIHTEQSESSNPKWYKASMDDFCDSSLSSVTATGMDGTAHSFAKSQNFVDTIVFGTDISSVDDNFLYGWTNFVGNVDLANSEISALGANFMAGCTKFNNALNLNKIIRIKPNFLKGCTDYNTAITFNADAELLEIDENFMGGCTAYNQPITLPTMNDLWIFPNFMNGCSSFNQPITLPSTVKYVGSNFMSQCNAFTSALTVNCPVDGVIVDSNGTLSSVDSEAAIHKYGFTVDGTRASEFKQVYQTSDTSPYYRKIISDEWIGQVTTENFNSQTTELQSSYDLVLGLDDYNYTYFPNTTTNAATDYSVCALGESSTESGTVVKICSVPADYSSTSAKGVKFAYGGKALGEKFNNRLFNTVELQYRNEANADYILGLVHQIASGHAGSSWTLNVQNKWYECTFTEADEGGAEYQVKYVIRFNKDTDETTGLHPIDYGAIYTRKNSSDTWHLQVGGNISYLGKAQATFGSEEAGEEKITVPTETTIKNVFDVDSTSHQASVMDLNTKHDGIHAMWTMEVTADLLSDATKDSIELGLFAPGETEKAITNWYDTDESAFILRLRNGEVENIYASRDTNTDKVYIPKVSDGEAQIQTGDKLLILSTCNGMVHNVKTEAEALTFKAVQTTQPIYSGANFNYSLEGVSESASTVSFFKKYDSSTGTLSEEITEGFDAEQGKALTVYIKFANSSLDFSETGLGNKVSIINKNSSYFSSATGQSTSFTDLYSQTPADDKITYSGVKTDETNKYKIMELTIGKSLITDGSIAADVCLGLTSTQLDADISLNKAHYLSDASSGTHAQLAAFNDYGLSENSFSIKVLKEDYSFDDWVKIPFHDGTTTDWNLKTATSASPKHIYKLHDGHFVINIFSKQKISEGGEEGTGQTPEYFDLDIANSIFVDTNNVQHKGSEICGNFNKTEGTTGDDYKYATFEFDILADKFTFDIKDVILMWSFSQPK